SGTVVIASDTRDLQSGSTEIALELTEFPVPGTYLVRISLTGLSLEQAGAGQQYQATLFVNY
ncbi:MAG TPA: hypothetical protein VNZ52_12840, partial [Candidatus Thermoplasmatota archaeon]|nr:hypothetical protein [Candidatus Thermoplasmatota archaeon]